MGCYARCLLCFGDSHYFNILNSRLLVGTCHLKRRLHGLASKLSPLISLNLLYSLLFGLTHERLTLPHHLFVVVSIHLGSLKIRCTTHAAFTGSVLVFLTYIFDLLTIVVCVDAVVTPSLRVQRFLIFLRNSLDRGNRNVVTIAVVWRLNELPIVKCTCEVHFVHVD